MFRRVFLSKEIFKLILGQLFLKNISNIIQILPPYILFSLHSIGGDSSFHILRIIMYSETRLHSQ